MTQNKDPRSTPGTEPEPSDAFLESPSEKAASDSASIMGPREILMKHQFSGAHDARTRWAIDTETKTLTIEQETYGGKPYISTSLLTDLVLVILHREGVIAYNSDTEESWTPVRTDWKVRVKLGTVNLRAEFWQQNSFAGARQSTIELYPVMEA